MSDPEGMAKQERQRRDRSRRVVVLIAGIILLSLGDLAITLIYLRSIGMKETNPIAGYPIRLNQSVSALAAYNMLTVGVCVGSACCIAFAVTLRVRWLPGMPWRSLP